MCCSETSPANTPSKITAQDIINQMPQAFFSNEGVHELAAAMPIDDGIIRKFGRPKILEDGSIMYAGTSDDPPPEINGYTRNPENPCLFHPLWTPCKDRMQGVKLDKSTGAIDVAMVCGSQAAPQSMKKIKLIDCEGCPFKK